MPTDQRSAPDAFGELLRRFRLELGLTQEELAERASLSARGISDLERGVRTRPQRETVNLLGEALSLQPAERAAFVAASRRPIVPSSLSTFQSRGRRSSNTRFPGADLPIPSESLIGRDQEVAAVTAMLRGATIRLVTLTGPGGVGKTRLAIHAAAALQHHFPGGVAFVPLASIHEAALLLPTVAQALGVRETPGRSLEDGLAMALRGRRMLLVLDNLEQILESASDLARLLTACPDLRILVTSRVALRLASEYRAPVLPLALPDLASNVDPDDLAKSPAVQLFVRRAGQVRPDVDWLNDDVASVASICHRLDGLPLAIELAAARIAVLPPVALRAKLALALPMLTGGPRDQPERLQTMRNAISWSYELLSSQEQALFRRLAVFEGGFTLEAAEAVGVATVQATDSVFDGVAALVDASLLRPEDGPRSEPRFAMLETIREYGVECLTASGEEQLAREQHAAWMLAFAQQAEPQLFRWDQRTWGERLEAELPNLRAALAWFERNNNAECAQRLAGTLQTFGWSRGHLREGRAWLQRALAIPAESSSPARAWALLGGSTLAWFQGDYASAKAMAEEGLVFAREGGFALGVGHAHQMLANTAWAQGDLARAIALGEEAIARLREAKHIGLLSISLCDTATAALHCGDRARGEAWSSEGLALSRSLGNRWFIANHFSDLGAVEHAQNDLERAAQYYLESVRLFHEVDDTWFIASPLSGLAAVAVARDLPELAARLLGAAAALREVSGSAKWPYEQDRDRQTAAVASAALGEEWYARAEAAGRAVQIEQAIADALTLAADKE